jgi:GNAT superfamily N-acetyltransferase
VVETGFAEAGDAAGIAGLLSSGFAPEYTGALIYACMGAAEYIRMQIGCGILNAEALFVVARAADGMAGAAEIRRRPQGLFLNSIGVRAGYRGRGIGTALLAAAVKMSGVDSGVIGLDALEESPGVLKWYGRLGFAWRASAEFLELAPPGDAAGKPAYVSGLPQADVCQKRFGFSMFHVSSGKGSFSVGRIGEAWFRLTDAAAAGDPAVFAALRLLEPGRRILAVLPVAAAVPAQIVRRLATAHRMETEIVQLMLKIVE